MSEEGLPGRLYTPRPKSHIFDQTPQKGLSEVRRQHQQGHPFGSLRSIVGPGERLRTAWERIAKTRLGAGVGRMSALEIQNLHNDAFDVEQVTKRFFDDYTKVYFELQEGRRVLRSLQPQ